jgi:hypothetical protein
MRRGTFPNQLASVQDRGDGVHRQFEKRVAFGSRTGEIAFRPKAKQGIHLNGGLAFSVIRFKGDSWD